MQIRRREREYVSEFTQFIDDFLRQHPEVIKSQREGWNIYWNRPVNIEELKKATKDNVPTEPYYYR